MYAYVSMYVYKYIRIHQVHPHVCVCMYVCIIYVYTSIAPQPPSHLVGGMQLPVAKRHTSARADGDMAASAWGVCMYVCV